LESYFAFLDDEPEFTCLLQWENLEKGRHLTKANHLLIHFIGLCFIDHSNRFSLSQSLNLDLGNVEVKQQGLRQVLALVFAGIAKR